MGLSGFFYFRQAQKERTKIMSEEYQLLRLDQVLEILPIGKSTFWGWVKDGKAPKSIKLGSRTTCWRKSDILKMIDDLSVTRN